MYTENYSKILKENTTWASLG